MASSKDDPWYKNGLCFSCTGCGECCTGTPGYVWLLKEDIKHLANHLDLTEEAFIRRFTKQVGSKISLLEMPKTFDCVFFKDKQCTVYQARPKQCRTYPFWSSIVKSRKTWDEEAGYCEGINRQEGEKYSAQEIENLIDPT